MDPDWKIQTGLRAKSGARNKKAATHPLTSESLIQICSDLQLGFVISPINVGFNALHHEHAGPWKDWNLYDCTKIRSASSVT
jgi:hypothetical protein